MCGSDRSIPGHCAGCDEAGPDHVLWQAADAWELLQAVYTQWIYAGSYPVGLHYPALYAVADSLHIVIDSNVLWFVRQVEAAHTNAVVEYMERYREG